MKTLIMLSLFLISSAFAKTIIITDIDDTIRKTNVVDKINATFRLIGETYTYKGLHTIYQAFEKNAKNTGEDLLIFYISASIPLLYNGEEWIAKMHLPPGKVTQRNSPFENKKEYKKQSIRNFLKEHFVHGDQVLYFGDNAEIDPQVYSEVNYEEKTNGQIFIRDVFANVSIYSPKKDGKKLNGINYYTSELELLQYEEINSLGENLITKLINLASNKQLIPRYIRQRIQSQMKSCHKYNKHASHGASKCRSSARRLSSSWIKKINLQLINRISEFGLLK